MTEAATKAKTATKRKRGRVSASILAAIEAEEKQKQTAQQLKDEDLIWGDLSDDDEFYNSYKETSETTAKRRKLNTKVVQVNTKVTPKKSKDKPPFHKPISSDFIIKILHKTGLEDITKIDDLYITYKGTGDMAYIYRLNDEFVGFYILNDEDLHQVFTQEEIAFAHYLDNLLIKPAPFTKSIRLETFVGRKI
jgi:hypothetical protein